MLSETEGLLLNGDVFSISILSFILTSFKSRFMLLSSISNLSNRSTKSISTRDDSFLVLNFTSFFVYSNS